MTTSTYIHIVSALPPQSDDLGDYALNLALHLRQLYGIQSRFIICDPTWSGPSNIEGFQVRCLRIRSEAAIWGLLASAKEKRPTVLLHYAGTGYSYLGIPVWLYQGIQSWLDERSGAVEMDRRFCTVFHELWETCAKPWKSKFYLWRLQRSIVKGFYLRSKISITSTQCMKDLLDGIERHKILCVPNPSSLPMFDRSQSTVRSSKGLRLGISGEEESRVATIRAHTNLIRMMYEKNLLVCATLLSNGTQTGERVGEDVQLLKKCIPPQFIEVRSARSLDDASRFFGQSDIYLSHSSGQLACKSSECMAALAMGCASVLCEGGNVDPLIEGEHFIASNDSPQSVKRIEEMAMSGQFARISAAARSWYEQHADWNVIARQYRDAIERESLYDGKRLINNDARNSSQKETVEIAAAPVGAC